MVKNSSENAVTIDDLAVMIANGFNETKLNLDSFELRMDSFESKLDSLEGKIDNMEVKVDRIDSRLSNQLDYVMLHYAKRTELDMVSNRMTKLERGR